jgi:hypothetical protein
MRHFGVHCLNCDGQFEFYIFRIDSKEHMFVLRTMSQNFKYVTKYLQMGGRTLKPYTVNIKNVKFLLPLCFT